MFRIDGVVRVACVLALAGALTLAGCATQPQQSPRPGPSPALGSRAAPMAQPAASRSSDVAAELTAQYRDTRADCGNSNSPAYLCSGVLFRGTRASTAYHSWNPSPGSQQRGGVSLSYLRVDSKFNRLAYGYTNGLISSPFSSSVAANCVRTCSAPFLSMPGLTGAATRDAGHILSFLL